MQEQEDSQFPALTLEDTLSFSLLQEREEKQVQSPVCTATVLPGSTAQFQNLSVTHIRTENAGLQKFRDRISPYPFTKGDLYLTFNHKIKHHILNPASKIQKQRK